MHSKGDSKNAEKEKVFAVPSMGMKSFMGKNLSSNKGKEKPGLFDKLKPKSSKKDDKGKDKK